MKTTAADLCAAIQNRQRVTFKYDGTMRLAEPYALGQTVEGVMTLRAWQNAGDGTGWRMFCVSRMACVEVTDLIFQSMRISPDPTNQMFSMTICGLH